MPIGNTYRRTAKENRKGRKGVFAVNPPAGADVRPPAGGSKERKVVNPAGESVGNFG